MTTNSSNRRVVSSETKNGKTSIKYSDGTVKHHFHNSKISSASKSSTNHTSKGKTSTSKNSGTGSTGGYKHSAYSYQSNKPAHAFTAFGIQFWGSPKHKLDDVLFAEGDLIINCTGTKWTPKAPPVARVFAKIVPEWMKVPNILVSPTKEHNNGELADQLLLDWPDMRPPPDHADLDFWSVILDQIKEQNVKRVVVCCQAGQGRTGTALASFLLASGAVDEPDLAIDYIRENYNDKAIETKGQEEYLYGLIYEEVEPASETSKTKNL